MARADARKNVRKDALKLVHVNKEMIVQMAIIPMARVDARKNVRKVALKLVHVNKEMIVQMV